MTKLLLARGESVDYGATFQRGDGPNRYRWWETLSSGEQGRVWKPLPHGRITVSDPSSSGEREVDEWRILSCDGEVLVLVPEGG